MKKANKQITEEKKDPIYHFGFNKDNYKWLFIGLGINVLGFLAHDRWWSRFSRKI